MNTHHTKYVQFKRTDGMVSAHYYMDLSSLPQNMREHAKQGNEKLYESLRQHGYDCYLERWIATSQPPSVAVYMEDAPQSITGIGNTHLLEHFFEGRVKAHAEAVL